MKEWWKSKQEAMRRRKRGHGGYTFKDFFTDVLLWLPELIVFPFRIIFWMIRGLGRLLRDVFDFV
ncbi:hypothetical protein [Virgibacillus doumboii]|uniref:hypothetical protein n=1 Tax=Virgibacillus doumboii TaxID=2697503 RepID=UPI0013E05CBE|nr:hypothetical protein [Virgibacillus doumboii]